MLLSYATGSGCLRASRGIGGVLINDICASLFRTIITTELIDTFDVTRSFKIESKKLCQIDAPI